MMPQQPPEVPAIGPAEAYQLISDGALLIDVREQTEWDEARIPGAEFKPMSEINEWYETLPKDKQIIVQCKSGGRSARVVHALMTQAGFDNVTNLTGGILGWSEAELPIETGE